MSSSRQGRAPRVLYVINSFDRGGAESGLVAMVEGALFAGCTLAIAALVRGSGGLERKLAALGHEPIVLNDRPRMRNRDMPGAFAALRRLVAQFRPDIVIASLPQANLLARLCVLWRRDVLFVSFEHNTHLARRLYEIGYLLTSWRVDWVFADARSTLQPVLERLYLRVPRRQSVVPLVSFVQVPARVADVAVAGAFKVANAARFTVIKNQAALIEAVALLTRAGRDVVLTLYGEGPERDACQGLAAQLGIGSRVLFPGFDSAWSQQPADLFVLASRHEGLCIVVLEAMNAGIPVAAPLIGGLRDYAQGYLAETLDSIEPQAIAACIAAVMDHPAAARSTARSATRMVEHSYGAAAVRKVYDDLNRLMVASLAPGH